MSFKENILFSRFSLSIFSRKLSFILKKSFISSDVYFPSLLKRFFDNLKADFPSLSFLTFLSFLIYLNIYYTNIIYNTIIFIFNIKEFVFNRRFKIKIILKPSVVLLLEEISLFPCHFKAFY